MIGSLEGVPLCIIGGDKDTKETALIKDLTKFLRKKKYILIIYLKMLVIMRGSDEII